MRGSAAIPEWCGGRWMMRQGTRERVKLWAKRFGWTALAFYTVKGLFWLLVGWGAWSAIK
jgi:hypothetical protein